MFIICIFTPSCGLVFMSALFLPVGIKIAIHVHLRHCPCNHVIGISNIIFVCGILMTNIWSQWCFESSILYHSFNSHEVCLNLRSIRVVYGIVLFLWFPRECNSIIFMDKTCNWSSIHHIFRKIRVYPYFLPWILIYLVQILDFSFAFSIMYHHLICCAFYLEYIIGTCGWRNRYRTK